MRVRFRKELAAGKAAASMLKGVIIPSTWSEGETV